MNYKKNILKAILLFIYFQSSGYLYALSKVVKPGNNNLAKSIYNALPNDKLILLAGVHKGPIIINKPIKIIGNKGAIINANGNGSVILINSSDVVIKKIIITGSGKSLEKMDSGVFINKNLKNVFISQNSIIDNLFGIYLWGPLGANIENNIITGLKTGSTNSRGNGISIWNSPNSTIKNNKISFGRDGVFITSSKNNKFKNNIFFNVRIAIHYMYTHNSEVSNNLSIANHVGFALMYSDSLIVKNNSSINDRDHGILLNFANNSLIENNTVRDGKKKCVFIYNSNKNRFIGNNFIGCLIGIHFTAGSEKNIIFKNSFIKNKTQVKYIGTKNIDWSYKGIGNYWSDNPSFDLNNDNISDFTYRPNSYMDHIIWAYPSAKLLLNSPSVYLLGWIQKKIPGLYPGGIIDSSPMMLPNNYKLTRIYIK